MSLLKIKHFNEKINANLSFKNSIINCIVFWASSESPIIVVVVETSSVAFGLSDAHKSLFAIHVVYKIKPGDKRGKTEEPTFPLL